MTEFDAYVPQTAYTIYIAATPDQAWQALTSPEFSRRYFSGFAVEIEQRVDGALLVRSPDGSPHITGEVIVCDPPRKLSMTWNVGWPGLIEAIGGTLVTYAIEPAGDAVRLTIIEAHERPLDDDILSGGRQGWPAIMSGLKSLLETGSVPKIVTPPPLRLFEALKRRGVTIPGAPD